MDYPTIYLRAMRERYLEQGDPQKADLVCLNHTVVSRQGKRPKRMRLEHLLIPTARGQK